MATKKKISKKEKTVALGLLENFEEIITENCFYIDKTAFIKEWWEEKDDVTVITRPRRFGKTVMLNTVECFFSNQYANRSDLFKGLDIWKDKEFRKLQGTYPVISISFANVKSETYNETYEAICGILFDLYCEMEYILESDKISETKKKMFHNTMDDLENNKKTSRVKTALKRLSILLKIYYDKPVIILIDEYDTPMEKAYVYGYWDKMLSFISQFLTSSFKTNNALERAILIGTTQISQNSLCSDFNNYVVSSIFSNRYAQYFGFTEKEISNALKTYGIATPQYKKQVKLYYSGFQFGNISNIYNPCSILHFLKENQFIKYKNSKFDSYCIDEIGINLIDYILRTNNIDLKMDFERLLQGHSITTQLDKSISWNEITWNDTNIWSFMVATGYLKVINTIKLTNEEDDDIDNIQYEIMITNNETLNMFYYFINKCISNNENYYNQFIQALLRGDRSSMQDYLQDLAINCFSYWDVGSSKFEPPKPKEKLGQNKEILKEQEKQEKIVLPEKFYHGLILGLVAELWNQYVITSNRESGIGRYDCILNPKDKSKLAYILEFKVCHPKREKTLKQALKVGLQQIQNENYAQILLEDGVPKENIKKFAFAFKGKDVLVGEI